MENHEDKKQLFMKTIKFCI